MEGSFNYRATVLSRKACFLFTETTRVYTMLALLEL